MSALVASNIKKELKIPYVVTFHTFGLVRLAHQEDMDKFSSQRFDIERMIVKDADLIIAECPQDKEDLVQYYNAERSSISIALCEFNPNEFYVIDKKIARQTVHLNPHENILLYLGRIVPGRC